MPGRGQMTGTAAEWAGLAMPSTGDYILPGGLAPLHLDRDTGEGAYIEPGICVQHQ
jgi:hypothetical protein